MPHLPSHGRMSAGMSATSERTDEFLSCDDGEKENLEGNGREEKKMELDIAAINIEVNEEKKEKPESTRAGTKVSIPKLNLPEAAGMSSRGQGMETPSAVSSRRDQQSNDFRLPTMHESDYGNDPLDLCHIATTNVSHNDSAQQDEAEK